MILIWKYNLSRAQGQAFSLEKTPAIC